jgi:hypothetical protein
MVKMRTVIPIAAARPTAGADDGWQRLSTLSEPRLSEMAENYRQLGHEVEVRDVKNADGGCNTCFDAGREIGQVFGTLYVRRTKAPSDDPLFD